MTSQVLVHTDIIINGEIIMDLRYDVGQIDVVVK